MTSFVVVHELTLYKPRSQDPTETAVLAQLEDAAQTFIVTTKPTDTHPYLGKVPAIGGGKLDFLKRTVPTRELVLTVLDKRVTGADATSLDRWWTRFLGDAKGQNQQLKVRARLRESQDGGATFNPLFTGRLFRTEFSKDRTTVSLTIRDLPDDLSVDVFVGAPHGSIAYAHPAPLLPVGISAAYGKFPITKPLTGLVSEVAFAEGTAIICDLTKVKGRANVLTDALTEVINHQAPDDNPSGYRFGLWPDARVHVKIIASPSAPGRVGQAGDFYLAEARRQSSDDDKPSPVNLYFDKEGLTRVSGVGIAPLPATDPKYLAAPSYDDTVEFYLYRSGPPTALSPLLIDDVHPAVLKQDMLAGKFGQLDASGAPLITFPANAAQFAVLTADNTIGTFRGVITGPETFREFDEKTLCLPYQLAYRINEDGEYFPIDLRVPSTLAGVLTISDADLPGGKDGQGAATWIHDVDSAVTKLTVKSYVDRLLEDTDVREQGSKTPASLIQSDVVESDFLFEKYGDWNEQAVEIDAIGFRASSFDVTDSLNRTEYIKRQIVALKESFRSPLGTGSAIATLKCRRTANTNGCKAGDIRLVQINALPDPHTNRRGGTRAMRCLERTLDGLTIQLRMLDLGPNAFADPPVISAIAQHAGDTHHAVDATVALNGAGEPAVVWFAVTDTATGARPADNDARWVFGARVIANGTVSFGRLPSGKRVWIRARTEVSQSNVMKLPSVWAYPGAGHTDTAALAAPSAVAGVLSGRSCALTWTNGEANYPVMPVAAKTPAAVVNYRNQPLPQGSKSFVFDELDPVQYSLGVKHVDDYGGEGAAATVLKTPGAANVLRTPRNLHITQGRPTAAVTPQPSETLSIGTGVEVAFTSLESHAHTRIQISTDPAFATVDQNLVVPPGVERAFIYTPLDDVERYTRAAAIRDNFTDSPWSDVASAKPTLLLPVAGADKFATGSAELMEDPDGTLRRVIDSDDPDTDGAYFEISIGDPGDPFPTVDDTDTFVARSAMPSDVNTGLRRAPEQVARMTCKFWNEVGGFGETIRTTLAAPSPQGGTGVELTVGLQAAGGILTITVATLDDGAARWHAYARLGAQPTLDGTNTPDSTPDIHYQVADYPRSTRSRSFAAADGTWYVIAVAEDANGNRGPLFYASIVIAGGVGGPAGQLTDIAVRLTGGTKDRISWTHDAVAGGYTVRILQAIDGDVPVELVAGRDPKLDGAADTVANQGYFDTGLLGVCNKGSSSDCLYHQYVYTIELKNGAALVATYTVSKYQYSLILA